MKTIFINILFGAILAYSGVAYSQSFCATPAESKNMKYNLSLQEEFSKNSSYCLKIYVHVIRRSDGTGGQSVADVNNALAFLDTDFNPHNIFFDWDGIIDYIDNTSYYNSPSSIIFSVNNHTDGIDIYLYDDAVGGSGLANGVGSSSEFYVTGSYWDPPFGSLVKSHVISHEMGHVLFLWHTHQSGSVSCDEFVNGSNCTTCGDFVCDTPADPYLGFNVDPNTCQWLGSGTDPNGDPYAPDEAIIMAYTHPDCMSYFTPGQGLRARQAIQTLPFLQQTVVACTGCPTDITITTNVFSGVTDHQEADLTITALNTVNSGGEAVYHAGEEVLLLDDFEALSGSVFRAYIEDCTGIFVPIASDDENADKNSSSLTEETLDEWPEGTNKIVLYPNPAKHHFDISTSKEPMTRIEIYDMNALVLKTHRLETPKHTYRVNISSFEAGIYFVRIVDSQGNQHIKRMVID